MKTLYFDCFSGISGDMIIGALLDLGLDFKFLEKELRKLNLKGYKISAKKVEKTGISATKFNLISTENHSERNIKDINKIIEDSRLDKKIKVEIMEIFQKIGKAESKIHGISLEKVHFHEIGAIDTIIDVAGCVIGIKNLGIEKIYCSKINTGCGFVEFSHGTWPIPTPATAELLKGIPIYNNGAEAELVTPTGAAIISHFASQFGQMPEMKVQEIGHGAGAKDLNQPNVLRIFLGEGQSFGNKTANILETNIDNMNPEFYPYVIEKLLDAGAMDAFLAPIIMKKGRPAVKLSVLVSKKKTDEICKVIFKETTTLGIRILEIEKRMLEREFKAIKTKYGNINIKISKLDGEIMNTTPEYEDCQAAARKFNVPLKKVYDEVKRNINRF